MKQKILALLALIGLAGCGSGVDLVGNATLANGTVTGNVTVQTPLGNYTFPDEAP